MRAIRQFQRSTVRCKVLHKYGEAELFGRSYRRFGWLASKRPTLHNKKYLLSHHWVRYVVSTIKVPNMGDSISEGTLVEWTKKVGDYCNVDDVVAIIETDKVSIDVRTDHSGVLAEQLAKVDDTLEVGAELFKIDTSAKAPESAKAPSTKAPEKPSGGAQPTAAAPPKQPEKKEQAAPKTPEKPAPKPAAPSISSSSPSSGKSREERRVPMSRMRQRIAERLKHAQESAASLTTFNEIDMSALVAMRSKHKDIFFEKHGVKMGFMSAFVKASVSALQAQPSINAFIDEERKELVFHDFCDISVAVASPNGLVVPVIRNAESLSFAEVEKKIQDYANRAKKGTLTLDEMAGGTFTISNGGVFGSLMGTPILNPPQSGILGMHGVFDRPIAINGNVEIRPMMYVALTYDHRIVDGREAVLFLKRIKETIEDPNRLLLDC